MFELQARSIDKWPRAFTVDRKRGPFIRDYGTVMAECGRELELIEAKSAVLLMALQESEIRIDGRPRAGARPSHPGIILAVETNGMGALRFPCDTYDDWLANLRAITLHLKALRAIDRYGVSVSREQYTGWAALPSPNGDHWDLAASVDFISVTIGEPRAKWFPADTRRAITEAEKRTHPDKRGNPDEFKKVQQARKLILG